MKTTKHAPPIRNAMLNTIANCETPISPSSDTKWLSGLYGWPSEPVYASAVTTEPSAMIAEPKRPVQIATRSSGVRVMTTPLPSAARRRRRPAPRGRRVAGSR